MQSLSKVITILLGVSLVSHISAKDTDYKKVDPKLMPIIEKMVSGKVDSPAVVPWRLYVPPEASEKNKLPLVFFLHGAGRRGNDNMGQMDLAAPIWAEAVQAKNPCFVLAPQCRVGTMWTKMNPAHTNSEADKDPTPEMGSALAILDSVLSQYPVDPDRIYVVGMSMGGFGTWDALYRRPNFFAAAVPICGGGDPSKASLFKDVPIWAWHGSNDKAVPVDNTRELIAALKKAGGDPKYSEIKAGHGAWMPAFEDPEFFVWLFSQKKR